MDGKQILGIGLIVLGVALSPTVAAQLGLDPIDDAIDASLFLGGLVLIGAKKK